jgi:23S rRNA (uracil1939-C5)-methyltransferase
MKREVELDIVDLAYNGKAVGYIDGKVTFVNGGLPGERVAAKIVKTKRRFNQAILLRVLSPSSDRIPAVCKHYDICGGCTWQDLDYDKQLQYKRNQVLATLKHIGGFDDVAVQDIRPSPDTFFYRNKMEFSFHVDENQQTARGFVLGLHERGRFDRIFDIEQCHLQSETSNRLVNFIRQKAADLQIPIYDLVSHRGFLRFLIIREGKNTGQLMVTLVSGEGEFDCKKELTASLIAAFPEITTLVWVVNPTITNVAKGDVREILHGPGYIEETILGLRFQINPASFFQTNSRQTEALYRTAIDLAEIEPKQTVLDLYCGAGTVGLCATSSAREIVGIEIEQEAIEAARINARLNRIENAHFYAGEVRTVMRTDEFQDRKFDRVFVDPPRAGMHPKALKRLTEIEAPRLVYISCNPATFARDAQLLTMSGYKLDTVVPFDMFPHTMHIELVSRFQKKG